jgi:acyl-CoA reductase-like NAD-dependent aldehyde dehydrogenase
VAGSEDYQDWSIPALKVYFEALRAADAAAISAALSAAEKAVQVAEVNAERWRNSANEWRAAMDDRERRFAQRDAMETADRNLQGQIDDLKPSRQSQQWVVTTVLAAISAFVAIGAVIAVIVHG